jgi:hypothetical protein
VDDAFEDTCEVGDDTDDADVEDDDDDDNDDEDDDDDDGDVGPANAKEDIDGRVDIKGTDVALATIEARLLLRETWKNCNTDGR